MKWSIACLLLAACPISALAQIAPSPRIQNGYARVGAIGIYFDFKRDGKNDAACRVAHHILYLSLAKDTSADNEDISDARDLIAKVCS